MISNTHLYGNDVSVPEIPKEVIVKRLEALRSNLKELMSVHYLDRDSKRVKDVLNAISFWEKINNV